MQSPDRAPQNAADQGQSQRYLQSWDALGKMLENGKSWSGRERNMAYLNTADGRFTDVSSVAGLAFPTDSRSLGFTDWDGDGDLDVWQANRSAPRVRFLQNQLDANGRYVRFRLRGTRCNRDAIGARLSVVLSDGKRLIKTPRAGEGYLAQSSKVLHVGLPRGVEIESVSVRWPGHAEEEMASKVEAGKVYEWRQGNGPNPLTSGSVRMIAAEPAADPAASAANIRLIPHAKLPLPALPYTTPEGKPSDLVAETEPALACSV